MSTKTTDHKIFEYTYDATGLFLEDKKKFEISSIDGASNNASSGTIQSINLLTIRYLTENVLLFLDEYLKIKTWGS